ncbi:hypothetical protein CHS0354_019306 [Potamilus streckersoni]|uniref:Transmembrane protein 59 n=1 Tax=Potamilus streckersoni TaxID=2493646 RepID=A0AAE0VVW7_9BIVA|nr:hypothetical protein CHS0354_019306 [Potamilus streckersoni]
MATKTEVLSIFLWLFLSLTKADVFESVLGDVKDCKDVCKNTYTPHTFEKNFLQDCCERGCRLYSMMEFIYDDQNTTKDVCQSSCREAYEKAEEYDACLMGCNSQIPFSQQRQQVETNQNIHVLYPLMFMHNVYSSMFDQMFQQMTYTWSKFFKEADGTVVIIQSQQQYPVYFYTENLDVPEEEEGEGEDEYKTVNYPETILEALDNSATPILKNSQLKSHQNDENDDVINLSVRDLQEMEDSSNDWLSCVAKKSGLPRLLLSILLLMCAVAMIWLCLTAAATAPDHRLFRKPQKLSINGDLEVMNAMLSQGLKPSYPQETAEVYPLPIKIKIQQV